MLLYLGVALEWGQNNAISRYWLEWGYSDEGWITELTLIRVLAQEVAYL